MAERDVMLLAVEMDASGAIKDTQILDDKFENLSKTFRKGTQETQKLDRVMAKQVKTTKDAKLANIDLSATYLKTLAGLDALTSGLNQGISAQYKMIDAKLASGEIDEEEAERKRKIWKAREKHTARLESAIALMRLATVVHMVYTAVIGATTTATTANTAAVTANTVAWYMNPMFWAIAGIVAGIALFIFSLAALMEKFKTLDTIMEGVNKQGEKFMNWVNDAKDVLGGFGEKVGETTDAIKDKLSLNALGGFS